MNEFKKRIFKNIIFTSISILIVFSLLWAFFFYKYGISYSQRIIQLKNNSIKNLIEGYFSKIYTIINFLSENRKIRNAIHLGDKEKREILELYKNIEKSDKDLKYIYSGYKNGTLLINNYIPPPGFNPTKRPWYIAALKSYPKINNGIPYREIKTKEWLISVSKALTDDKGEIIGVVALDSSIKKIIDLINKPDNNFKSLNSFIINSSGKILIYPSQKFLGKNIHKLLKNQFEFKSKSGFFKFKLNGYEKIGYFNKMENLPWISITIVNKKEIITPIFRKILTGIAITIFICILTAWFLTISLSEKIINPLIDLKERVQKIAQGDYEKSLCNVHYPDNEIGIIINEIEKLTEREIYKKNLELQKINKQLELLSLTDQLTGLYNRRKINEELEKEWMRAERYDTIFSVVIFDIDHFKKINDTFGHQIGDIVLVEISKILKRKIRSTDIPGRWGGEEFLIICPETRLFGAGMLANKIRLSIENFKFPITTKVTISAGVAQYSKGRTIEDIISEADEKLYKAKSLGRNMVVS